MIKKKMEAVKYRIQVGIRVGIAVVGLLFFGQSVAVQAATVHFETRITELKAKFPHGKYWNHVGMSTDNSDGYTDTPCGLHGASGVSHVYGTGGCTCNHFADSGHVSATQCMGFANKLGHDVFGDTTWITYNSPSAAQIADIRVGDIVRIDGYHSVFVIGRSGNVITIGEANYPNSCIINWDRQIDLTTVGVSYYERASNYDTVLGNSQEISTENSGTTEQVTTENMTTESTTPENPSTEGVTTETSSTDAPVTETPTTETNVSDKQTTEPERTEDGEQYTGWKLASDGVHYQYYKSGKLQKKIWITLDKKKYYVDKQGYMVTGFYDVNSVTYYFNEKGVMQKEKWLELDGETYYVNEDGLVLKNQWLWYDGGLVYVTENGSIARSELVKIASKTYYFNTKGKRSKGFKKCNGKYYYCDSKGVIQKKKWITQGNKKYYLQKSGVRAQSKILKIGKYKYYFNKKGRMEKNKRIVYKGDLYKADKKGRCRLIEENVAEE